MLRSDRYVQLKHADDSFRLQCPIQWPEVSGNSRLMRVTFWKRNAWLPVVRSQISETTRVRRTIRTRGFYPTLPHGSVTIRFESPHAKYPTCLCFSLSDVGLNFSQELVSVAIIISHFLQHLIIHMPRPCTLQLRASSHDEQPPTRQPPLLYVEPLNCIFRLPEIPKSRTE